MKVTPMSDQIERPSLEEIKLRAEQVHEDSITANGGLIPMDDSFYDFWAIKRKARINPLSDVE